ncbi:hypothetical protein GCM10009670_30030 [Citricoccus alkalitolerans]
MKISEMWAEAREHGWASGQGSLAEVQNQCLSLEWKTVAGRSGENGHSVLRPKEKSEAHQRSLSAVHGLGSQPLHVDGSHLLDPPDVVILTSSEPAITPTLLWNLPQATSARPPLAPWEDLAHGIFVVDTGKGQFLATAWDDETERGSLRFDPTIMQPSDSRAKRAYDYLSCASDNAHAFEWSAPQLVLLIDNRQVLHGRAAVSAGDDERRLDRLSYRTSDT